MKRKWIIALALLAIVAFLLINMLIGSWKEAADPDQAPATQTNQR